ncbi:MAG: DNA polymerase III subunit delta [Clostridia bacterium]|nr:DNA polymerase III subunit delta [Clostridia bacterium]MBR5746783.1 DNA polymerase III subunit delta [Clostridia bacterium]
MTPDILKNRIKENNISGVFLFYGQEEYTKDRYAETLRKKIDSEPLPEFNHLYYSAVSDKIADLDDMFYALPYMSEKKLIEINDIAEAKLTEADIQDYERVFSEVPDYLTVLIVLRSDDYSEEQKSAKAPKSGIAAFVNLVKECGGAVEFAPEKSDKLTPWIMRHFTAGGVKADPAVPREILNYCGTDMYVLQSEIAKLCDACSGRTVTVNDVHKYCCENTAYKYFDIAVALNRRDIVSAKKILDGLDLGRDEIPAAIGFLAKNYAELFMTKTGLESGKSHEALARDLKLPSWRVGKLVATAGSMDLKSLAYAVSQIASADVKIKSLRADPRRVLELTFYRICSYGRKA